MWASKRLCFRFCFSMRTTIDGDDWIDDNGTCCLKGVPAPQVSWLRNNVAIDPAKESNLIISSEGHLLIVQARLSDMGNYTCVAENVAARRLSDTVVLTVYGKSAPFHLFTRNHWKDSCQRVPGRIPMCSLFLVTAIPPPNYFVSVIQRSLKDAQRMLNAKNL